MFLGKTIHAAVIALMSGAGAAIGNITIESIAIGETARSVPAVIVRFGDGINRAAKADRLDAQPGWAAASSTP